MPFLWRPKHKKNNLQLTCKLALLQLRTTAWRSNRLVVRSPSRRLSNSPPLYCSCLVCFLPSMWKNTRLNVSCNYTTKVCFYVASNEAVVIQNGRVARNTCANISPGDGGAQAEQEQNSSHFCHCFCCTKCSENSMIWIIQCNLISGNFRDMNYSR